MSNFTPGPWELDVDIIVSTKEKDGAWPIICTMSRFNKDGEANAHLIATAPEGLAAAITAYKAILQIETNTWRVQNQTTYVLLRDFIAKATGRTSEEIQNEFEAKK